MKENDVANISELLTKVIDNLGDNRFENASSMRTVWKDIILSIRGPKYSHIEKPVFLGEKLYSHTKIIDLVNTVLLVEVDHSGWIQTLQFYNAYILRGLKKKIPELEILSIAYRVKGSNFEIKGLEKHRQNHVEVDTDKDINDEKIKLKIKNDLPDELKEKFIKLKKLSEKK